MRTFLLTLSFLLPVVANGADSLVIAQQLYQSGTPQLALQRIERDQPADVSAANWYEWESLRFTLLSQFGKSSELIGRMPLIPSNAPRDFLQKAYGHAAWAYLERNEGATARSYLARLLWQYPMTPADRQWARRLVIRSYLAEHKPDEAYRAMLRYQQDYSPLAKEAANEFVQGLLSEGHTTEAMTWLLDLEAGSPASLRLQMKAGMVAVDAAMEQAQAAMQAHPETAAEYLPILADAAKQSGKTKLLMDILEQELALGSQTGNIARDLWKAYVAQGEAAGNRVQLLLGDDASWLSSAAGTSESDPQEGRAIYAYLVNLNSNQETRDVALSRLFASLAARRPEAAVELFAAAPWGGEKNSLALIRNMVSKVDQGMPGLEMRPLWLAASRFAATQKRYDLAADYCAQSVLVSNMRNPDALAEKALKGAIENMERAGLKDDAAAFYMRISAQREPEKQKAPTKPSKSKAKK